MPPVVTAAPTAEPTQVPTSAPTATAVPAQIKHVTTSGGNLNVRTSPETGSVISKLPNGTQTEVLSTENGWSYVRATLSDGSTVEGYVSDAYLSDAAPTTAPTTTPTTEGTTAYVKTSGSALRLRSQASTSSTIVTRMPNGAQVTVLGTMNSWTHIQYTADGITYEGWASSDYITDTDEEDKPDTVPTAAPIEGDEAVATVTTSGSTLRMRAEPSTSSDVVTKIPNGTDVVVLNKGDEWSLCQYGDSVGYCSNDYLTFG